MKMPTARFPSRYKGLNEDKWRIVASRFCTEPFWNAIKRGTTKYDAGAATVHGAPLRSVTFRFASLPSFSPFSSTSHRLPPMPSPTHRARNTSVYPGTNFFFPNYHSFSLSLSLSIPNEITARFIRWTSFRNIIRG